MHAIRINHKSLLIVILHIFQAHNNSDVHLSRREYICDRKNKLSNKNNSIQQLSPTSYVNLLLY